MLPVGFEPTDEWAKGHLGMSLAEFYKQNPGAQQMVQSGALDPTGQYIQNTVQKLDEQYFGKIKEYDKNNPFIYDDVLKQEIAKAGTRLDPYYIQTLNDYTRGIDLTKSRSTEDLRKTLANLTSDISSYTETTKNNLADALEKSRQGYADVGLYFSGNEARNVAKTGLDTNNTLNEYTRGKQTSMDTATTSDQRAQQDANLKLGQFQRDIGHFDAATGKFVRGAQSEAEVRSQALPEVNARQQERQFGLGQYAGPPPGADPNMFYLNLYSGFS